MPAARLPVGVIVLCLGHTACGSPTTTTAPSPAIAQAVAVTANVGSITSAGQTTQATATATFSNGTSQDVTATCTGWQSDNVTVLTVNNTGLLTAHSNGSANITTTCQGLTGRGLMTVALNPTTPPPPSTFTLSGTVFDNYSHGILPNIAVRILSGPNAGAATMTDATGHYALGGLSPGTLTVSFSAVSYYTTTTTASVAGDERLDITLNRNLTSPGEGVYTYDLSLHFMSASGCVADDRPAPPPPPFADVTFTSSLTVTEGGNRLLFPLLPGGSPTGGSPPPATLNIVRSGNQLSGTLNGETRPWGFGTGPLVVILTLNIGSGTADNSNGHMTGVLRGEYDNEGMPSFYYCTNAQIAFTLVPHQ